MKKRTIACIMAGILLIAGLCAAMGRKEKTADAGTETETISATERGAETDTEAEVTEETVKEAAAGMHGCYITLMRGENGMTQRLTRPYRCIRTTGRS